jgi:teichuronic acid biosynthesis glycosyltransferase TuaC
VRTLVLSSLYPNPVQPRHGIFIENRVLDQVRSGRVEVRVVAPVAWFPFRQKLFGGYSRLAGIPHEDERQGLRVSHPRFPVVPKVGMTIAPALLAASLIRPIQRIIDEGFDFDILDSYYFYPDGVAAALLGRYFTKPVVITALGTDVNVISQYTLPRKMIQWAAHNSAGMTTVCQALKDRLVDLGAPEGSIRAVLHGVDLAVFRPPRDRKELLSRLGLKGPTLLSVGNLIELKGHHVAIKALKLLPAMELLVAGTGPDEGSLKRLAASVGVDSRVRFIGHVNHAELPDYYGAADALILASSREGIPNVLLESMACGTPVVATRVGGIPEVITAREAGLLVAERTPESLAAAVRDLLKDYPDRQSTRRFVEKYSWKQTTEDHLALFEDLLRDRTVARELLTTHPVQR